MKYYLKNKKEIFDILKTKDEGLDEKEVEKRIQEYGFNELKTGNKVSKLKILIDQFKSFIIYILLFAVFLSLLLKHYTDAILILIILIANSMIGFFQEYSAQKSLEALKKLNKISSRVYRDNKLINIDSKELVPGDIIFLEAGDKVGADARIIEAKRLKVEESTLTGESLPVEKHDFTLKEEVQIGERKNMLFSSTAIVEGSCKAIVVRTGMRTEIGKIAKMVNDVEDDMTPLQRKLDLFGKKLGVGIIIICLFIFGLLLFTKGLNNENIVIFGLVAVSLAVAAVPTALPAVVTIALSIGVKKLLKASLRMRKLSSVETLGSCNVICTDKTGTLTQNEMTVRNAWTLENECKIEGVGYNPSGKIESKIDKLLFKIGVTCNNSSIYRKDNLWKISGDPTEAALIVSGRKAGIFEEKFNRIDELPFDSNRKLMSVLIKEEKDLIQHTKGAPNEILKRCTHILKDGIQKEINEEDKKIINKKVDFYSSKALRVLGFAYKIPKDVKDFSEENLVFVGLQAMADPPRPDVIDAIKKTKEAGIRVIMITGDYKETAKAIGKEIGIEGEVITGDEIDSFTDNDLRRALNNNTNIFARVIPEHKQRIVTVLQDEGNVVAMTGDGVNDAPALRKANIGIAVGSGTDVAKEAADFVLLNDSFPSIVAAVEEGRGIYDNIQKSIMLLLSGNFGEVLIIFLAVIFGLNLPLTAVLLLWINLITDGAPALAFSVDPYSDNIMKRKPISASEGILPKRKIYLIGILGVIGSIIGLVIFYMINGGHQEGSSEHILAQTFLFNFVVVYEILLVFIIRKQFKVKQTSNKWLWYSILFSLVMQGVLMYIPFFSNLFKIQALDFYNLGLVILAGTIFYVLSIIYGYIDNYLYRRKI